MGVSHSTRPWTALGLAAAATLAVAACGFGVNTEDLFGGAAPDGGSVDGGANADGADGSNADAAPLPALEAVAARAGTSFTCALQGTALQGGGSVTCWGLGSSGQLGNDALEDSSTPVVVKGLTDAVSISVGNSHACAVRKTGVAVCWGKNGYGQLGNGSSDDSKVPAPVANLADVAQISAGADNTCAVKTDGSVYCWGLNNEGQLGDGTKLGAATPTRINGLTGVKQVEVYQRHSCAVTTAGSVLCWGDNFYGQSGQPSVTNRVQLPTRMESFAGVSSLAFGPSATHSCAILNSREMRCWGNNSYGILGSSSAEPGHIPRLPVGMLDVVSIATSQLNTCAVRNSGTLACWGRNEFRQAGQGASTSETFQAPVDVAEVSGAANVALGATHACSVLKSGKVRCWGSDLYGALGRARSLVSTVPVAAPSPAAGTHLALGNDHACAANATDVTCWGDYGNGQTGKLPIASDGLPIPLPPLGGTLTALAAGLLHTCAITTNGMYCWGYNGYGQFGNGSAAASSTASISAFTTAGPISAGNYRTCVISAGEVTCAGANSYQEVSGLTPGGAPDRYSNPTKVGGLTGVFTSVAVGDVHVCALSDQGVVWCWGNNAYRQVSPDVALNTSIQNPVRYPAALNLVASQVAAGNSFSCALVTNGTVRCWGNAARGEIGAGGAPTFPQKVVSISAGAGHSCALLDDATAYCWGQGTFGQLGNGARRDSPIPVKVNLTGIKAIAAGKDFTCARLDGGSVRCWGSNTKGQLGDTVALASGTAAEVVIK